MQVICRRCLLEDMAEERDFFSLLAEWIAALPEEDKAEPETYRTRLAVCKSCSELAGGMCRLCGCFVELRAAKAREFCPHLPPKWLNGNATL